MLATVFDRVARARGGAVRGLAALFAAAIALPAWAAGNFSVSPIRIEMSGAQRAAWFQVTNVGSQQAQLAIEATSWTQGDLNRDPLPPTTELAVTPPLFDLEPGERQIVRVLLLRPADPARQLAYRLIVQEQPRADSAGGIAIQTVLRLSLPAFVTPAKATAAVAWSLVRGPDGLALQATNAGNASALIARIATAAGEPLKDVGGYILAGETRRWPLAAPVDGLRVEYFGQPEQSVVVEAQK